MARVTQYQMRSKILAGAGSRALLATQLDLMGVRRIAVYSDHGVAQAGVLQKVLDVIEASDLEPVEIFTEIPQDARESVVDHAAAHARERGVEAVVAVGGGSVMDTAKGINFLLSTDHQRIGEVIMGAIGMVADPKPMKPFVALPTTAGTGSEVSAGAVFLNEETHVKAIFTHPWCAADIAILDADLTAGLPPRITAFTGMDALTHAVEAYTSRAANPLTGPWALGAVELIFKNLPRAVAQGDDLKARHAMLMASSMAIGAYANSPGGAVHALAHALGGWFGVPHGLANSLYLPHVLAFNREAIGARASALAGAIDPKAAAMPADEAASFVVERIRDLQRTVGLPARVSEVCDATAADFDKLAANAAGDFVLGLNPKPVGPEDLQALLAAAL